MKLALVGYGKMGRAVESVALERGHEVMAKIDPILEFTELDVWRYTAINEIPVNPKYREGFRSLGCAVCTVPEEDESYPERHGRWKGTVRERGECGIHTQTLKA